MILVYFINDPIITKIERKCIALNSFSYLWCRNDTPYFNNPIITKIERMCIALNSFSYLCLLNEALACFEQKKASRY